jgi:UDP-N-acetylmuramoylalanine--D-glutamate ligase
VNLLTGFLNSEGIKAAAVGNIGKSPLGIIDKDFEYIVIELSSFQLYYLNNLNLHIGIILNIYQDHLDWHKNFEEYLQSKKRIKQFIKNIDGSINENNFIGSLVPGSINSNLYSEIKEKSIFFDNTVDIFMEVIDKLELNYDSAKEYLINSENSEHRFELVDVHKGITYINDSKSTNFNSVSMATKKINNGVLIMHGLTKNMDSKDLDISKDIKKIILPKDMQVNLNNTKAEIIELESIFDLEEKLEKNLHSGDTVLFSCGGSSFNDFKNYKERGKFFKLVVSNIKVKNG